jgi:hypothetical protein
MDHEFQSSLGIFDRVQEDGHLPPRVDQGWMLQILLPKLTFNFNGLRLE